MWWRIKDLIDGIKEVIHDCFFKKKNVKKYKTCVKFSISILTMISLSYYLKLPIELVLIPLIPLITIAFIVLLPPQKKVNK